MASGHGKGSAVFLLSPEKLRGELLRIFGASYLMALI
jgi:hypothetical protein